MFTRMIIRLPYRFIQSEIGACAMTIYNICLAYPCVNFFVYLFSGEKWSCWSGLGALPVLFHWNTCIVFSVIHSYMASAASHKKQHSVWVESMDFDSVIYKMTRTLCAPCRTILLLYRVFFLSNLLLAFRSVMNLLYFYLSILTKSYMFFCQYDLSIFFSITDRNFIDTKL
jgi:hypothetical protein